MSENVAIGLLVVHAFISLAIYLAVAQLVDRVLKLERRVANSVLGSPGPTTTLAFPVDDLPPSVQVECVSRAIARVIVVRRGCPRCEAILSAADPDLSALIVPRTEDLHGFPVEAVEPEFVQRLLSTGLQLPIELHLLAVRGNALGTGAVDA